MVPQPTIQVLRIACNGETTNTDHKTKRYEHYNLKPDHPVFTDGDISQVSELLGQPLRVLMIRPSVKRGKPPPPDSWDQKQKWKNPLQGPEYYKNEISETLMMDLKTGGIPWKWSDNVGCVLIAREDRQPLDQVVLEHILNIIRRQRLQWEEEGVLPESE